MPDRRQPGPSRRLKRISETMVLAAAMALAGCAGPKKAAPPAAGGQTVKVDEGAELSDLAKGLKTREDSLILDLLEGYRMLLLRDPDPKTMDKEVVKRSRQAYERLEYVLRHGGVKAQEGGERVFSINNEDKLSLQEVIRSASLAGAKASREGDWERARARWREITQSRQAVAWSMEEAQWGLALADALESPLPDPMKKKLKDVHESYATEIGSDEIGKQVKVLLEEVKDEKLRRELKKLANRAWERDKRAGRLASASPAEPSDSAQKPPVANASPATSPGPDAAAGPPDAAHGLVDTLIGQGKYMAALKALEKTGEPSDQGWAKERKVRIGERFCEEKRRAAANAFKDFKKASDAAAKRVHLQRTAGDLDSCLFYFPELVVSQKVRRNREMVESEMKKLKP